MVKIGFQNAGAITVHLQDLKTTCSCLRAEVDKTVVQPGGKGTLTLTYHSSTNPATESPLSVQALIAPTMYLLELPIVLSNE